MIKKTQRNHAGGATVTKSIFDAVATLDIQDTNTTSPNDELSRKDSKTKRSNNNSTNIKPPMMISHSNIRRDVQRSLAAQAQMSIYHSLVECRILLQRSMISLSSQQQQVDDDHEIEKPMMKQDASSSPIEQCNELLVQLLKARRMLFQPINDKADPEGNNIDHMVDYKKLLDSSIGHDENELYVQQQIQNEYDFYRNTFWKDILNQKHRDIQLHSGMITNKTQQKYRIMDASFFQLVESIVQHELLRNNNDSSGSSNRSQQQYGIQPHDNVNHPSCNTYTMFDDTKVYQQLLKDFVDTNQQQQSLLAHTIESRKRLHKKSNHIKKNDILVDRKASKGRKIRYTTISKLTNFTFPIQRMQDSHTILFDDDAWFRSLFGGTMRTSSTIITTAYAS